MAYLSVYWRCPMAGKSREGVPALKNASKEFLEEQEEQAGDTSAGGRREMWDRPAE
jgi:hypothetical protein